MKKYITAYRSEYSSIILLTDDTMEKALAYQPENMVRMTVPKLVELEDLPDDEILVNQIALVDHKIKTLKDRFFEEISELEQEKAELQALTYGE